MLEINVSKILKYQRETENLSMVLKTIKTRQCLTSSPDIKPEIVSFSMTTPTGKFNLDLGDVTRQKMLSLVQIHVDAPFRS